MHNLEWNKILGSVLLAGIIAMVTGFVSDGLYHPEKEPKTRGFQVAVADNASAGAGTAAAGGTKDAGLTAEQITALLSKADAAAGKNETKKCAACHSFDKGGPHKVGPNLFGIVDANIGQIPGYTYSPAMKGKGGTWTEAELMQFLVAPKKYLPGTKMGFAGFPKPEEAANTVAYLKTLK